MGGTKTENGKRKRETRRGNRETGKWQNQRPKPNLNPSLSVTSFSSLSFSLLFPFEWLVLTSHDKLKPRKFFLPLFQQFYAYRYQVEIFIERFVLFVNAPGFVQDSVNNLLIHSCIRNRCFNINQPRIGLFFDWRRRIFVFLFIHFFSVRLFSICLFPVCFFSISLLAICFFSMGLTSVEILLEFLGSENTIITIKKKDKQQL